MVTEMVSKEGARQMVTPADMPMFERAGWVKYVPVVKEERKQDTIPKKRNK